MRESVIGHVETKTGNQMPARCGEAERYPVSDGVNRPQDKYDNV